ncbi:hypothetical protein BIV60_08785 [Bacillus sp. MUM 116]|uniref:hypothetical protein n=1 Tax=Bacillus sp. MUM 116 TaxID=1678002 RepID=UPI0008F5A239|nr:hypothetical protein [Bacillus sp. MUM 116]OIK15628.1 hypothetical protein BIV60_08785 [Bacillus sp. MUM 116]
MKGIYFINDQIKINNLSKEESFTLQEQVILNHIQECDIQVMKLNPNQIYQHYTNPHALLYDLKKNKSQLDCLVLYSPEVMEDFIYTYPARWLILKSYFKEVITLEGKNDQLSIKNVI